MWSFFYNGKGQLTYVVEKTGYFGVQPIRVYNIAKCAVYMEVIVGPNVISLALTKSSNQLSHSSFRHLRFIKLEESFILQLAWVFL